MVVKKKSEIVSAINSERKCSTKIYIYKTFILIIGDKPKWHTIEGYVKDIYERGGNHKIQRII